ncbi:hypothetical protein FOH24_17240 [Acetobacter tropicalis]|uniref:Uncharacterized protein n=1 Tax=Acetobacter tropicalis TaxID=104102 RepID=A0A094YKT6_9PROT|nr:hypothetical protein [Acetobacter tropicalis]KAA8383757.1 hypothetical protein FOH24_17240 [Acetobacter tropicalis]KAA8383800.1 hypothetical protein FOH22_15975 [Acetobacter tropicalis]KGB21957.1 hypothetical protein AtDm6_2667 [Acetobacter tropicalis]MBC9010087.1 hypothetical protein [Acetobacter tropicalis]MDO8170703.1 hypothetical protein [Acetobacter tropicalis]
MTQLQDMDLCSDLYDVLENCTNEELDPIVDVLRQSQQSVLKISRAFENYFPDHMHYAGRIGDEIYRLGLQALGRNDGKRPSYTEIIGGLCKQVGFPSTLTGEDEATLLNLFSKQYLSLRPSAVDQQALVNEAATAAAAAVRGILSSDAWPPFAAVMLQIIYLRRKMIAEGRIQAASITGTEIRSSSASIDNAVNSVIIQTENGDRVLSLATIPDTDTIGWRDTDYSRNLLNVLTPILKAAQPFISTEQLLKNGNYYRAEMVLSYSEKLGHYVGTAKGHQGMVRLDPASLVSLATPAGLLTLAAAMAEQKKLEAIEKSLDEIKASIKDVSKFQQNERRSIITASIRYFQQVAPSVLTGELPNEVLQVIERHEVDLVRVQEHLISDIRAQVVAFNAIKKEGWGSSKYATAIKEAQTSIERMCDEILLCIRARACGYQLLCAFPGRDTGKKVRLQDIANALSTLSSMGEIGLLIDKAFREKIQGISSYEIKASVLAYENALFDKVTIESTGIIKGLNDATKEISEQTEALSVDIKVQDGVPVAIRMA